MKRTILIFILLLSFALSGCNISKTNSDESYLVSTVEYDTEQLNNYEITADLDTERNLLYVKQTLTMTNTIGIDLDEIYFHVYSNSYGEYDAHTSPASQRLNRYKNAGLMNISILKVNGEKIEDYEFSGIDKSILGISLPATLEKNQTATIYFEYDMKLPEREDALLRYGVRNFSFKLAQWYPILAVYDKDGWNLDPYYYVGDPFYSDVANYNVSISFPDTPPEYLKEDQPNFIVAASGKPISNPVFKKGKITHSFFSEAQRDFVLVFNPYFEVYEAQVGETTIKIYTYDTQQSNTIIAGKITPERILVAMEAAKDAVTIYSDLYGTYPYKTLSVVQTSFPGAMEFPGLVYIAESAFLEEVSEEALEEYIAHEIAHQWWYGVVGNDEVEDAWIDEGLATYSEVLYTYEKYGEEAASEYYIEDVIDDFKFSYSNFQLGIDMTKSIPEYVDWSDYIANVYRRSAMFLHYLRTTYGEVEFLTFLKDTYQTYQFDNMSTEEYIQMIYKHFEISQEDLNSWLYEGRFEEPSE